MTVKERHCKNWLDTFMQWTLPRSEAPESFVFWSGVYTIAAVLRRKVKIPKKYLGSWECPPHMYVFFIGPAGGPKKTTTMSYCIELLDELGDVITKGPTLVSQAALLTKLVESHDNSVYLTVEEFSDVVMKGGNEMYEFLTSMFDGKKSIESSTISRGVEFVEKPCVNMIAASTPIWMSENMSEAIIGGGFSSRIIAIYEETARRSRMYYRNDVDFGHLDELKYKLVQDLIHIEQHIEGDFEIEPDALDFMENWYQEHEEKKKKGVPKALIGYHNRKPAHVHKLAMILHIAYSDDLILTVDDFKRALVELEKIEKNLPRVFEGMGKNPHTFDMRYIADYVKEVGKVERPELLNQFKAAAPPSMLNQLIEALISMKVIKLEVDADGKQFYIPGKRA